MADAAEHQSPGDSQMAEALEHASSSDSSMPEAPEPSTSGTNRAAAHELISLSDSSVEDVTEQQKTSEVIVELSSDQSTPAATVEATVSEEVALSFSCIPKVERMSPDQVEVPIQSTTAEAIATTSTSSGPSAPANTIQLITLKRPQRSVSHILQSRIDTNKLPFKTPLDFMIPSWARSTFGSTKAPEVPFKNPFESTKAPEVPFKNPFESTTAPEVPSISEPSDAEKFLDKFEKRFPADPLTYFPESYNPLANITEPVPLDWESILSSIEPHRNETDTYLRGYFEIKEEEEDDYETPKGQEELEKNSLHNQFESMEYEISRKREKERERESSTELSTSTQPDKPPAQPDAEADEPPAQPDMEADEPPAQPDAEAVEPPAQPDIEVEAVEPPAQPNAEATPGKEEEPVISVFSVRWSNLYVRKFPDEVEPRRALQTIVNAWDLVRRTLLNMGTPFPVFVEYMRPLVMNQWLIFEYLQGNACENSEYEGMSRINYVIMLRLRNEADRYLQEGLNHCCESALNYIKTTIHRTDIFNHGMYRAQGRTSLWNRLLARHYLKDVVKKGRLYLREPSSFPKSTGNATVDCLNAEEKERLRHKAYAYFFVYYNRFIRQMEEFRKKYYKDGLAKERRLASQLDEGTWLREHGVAVVTANVESYIIHNRRPVVQIEGNVIDRYVEMFMAREFQEEVAYQGLYNSLRANLARDEEVHQEEGEGSEHFNIRSVIMNEFKNLMRVLMRFEEHFLFAVDSIFFILFKTLDIFTCFHLLQRKVDRRLAQLRVSSPVTRSKSTVLDHTIAETKVVVVSLQKLIREKIVYLQGQLESNKNPNFGNLHNSVIDFMKLRIHKLDCVNPSVGYYKTDHYRSLSGRNQVASWSVKLAEVRKLLEERTEGDLYREDLHYDDLPPNQRRFIDKQRELYQQNPYEEIVRCAESLTFQVGQLRHKCQHAIKRQFECHPTELPRSEEP